MAEENNGASGGEGGAAGGNPGDGGAANEGNQGGTGGNQGNAGQNYSMDDFRNTQWREAISDEGNRTHGSLANIKTMDDFAKSYVNAQKLISGKNQISHPEEGDTEGWNTLYDKLGRPETSEGYEFKLPEGAPDHWTSKNFKTYQDAFKKQAHDAGLTKKQAEQQWGFVQGRALEGYNAQNQAQQQMINQNIEAVKQEFGANLTVAVNKRDALVNKFGGPEAVKFIKSNPVLNSSPIVLKMFNEMAKNFGEDVIMEATMNPGGSMTPSEAESKLNAMMMDPKGAYKDLKHPDHANAAKEFQRLLKLKNAGKK